MSTESLNIAIIGAAESGLGAALLAKDQGHSVWVTDSGQINPLYKAELIKNHLPFEEQGHSLNRLLEADLVIKSPGVPNKAPVIIDLKNAGKTILSEIEYAAPYFGGKVIGITGSNGKTTTTLLTGHLLETGKISAKTAGNVGNSFAASLAQDETLPDWFVLEVSSFQLDDCYAFAPNIAMILNITPDHLDRYEYTFSKYVDAKFRILQSQKPSDYFIYQKEDKGVRDGIQRHGFKSQGLPVSMHALTSNEEGGWYDDQFLHFKVGGIHCEIAYKNLPLQGIHNRLNMLSAGLAALLAGVSKEALVEGLSTFVNAPHRLEVVSDANNVLWINDSKATNVDSVFYALESMNRPVIWIAGGIDKGNDYSGLADLVLEKVKALIALGKDNEPLLSFFEDRISAIYSTDTIEKAIETAYSISKSGDVVLLSPACASFDLFKNYEDRGNQFRKYVLDIIKRNQNL